MQIEPEDDTEKLPVFPRKKSGKPKDPVKLAEREAAERKADLDLCRWIERHKRKNGFAFGARGWGYILEGHSVITKGQLDAFEKWLGDMRKAGHLDPDVVSDDDNRTADYIEVIDTTEPGAEADRLIDSLINWVNLYQPLSLWEGLEFYVEVAVEKVDLKVLFGPVCRRFHVALTNVKGSSDINARRRMLQRFKAHSKAGRICILLYFGDHDPMGLRIAKDLSSNLFDCKDIRDVQFDPTGKVEVVRIGLTLDHINQIQVDSGGHDPWIHNLITSSGKDLIGLDKHGKPHPDRNKDYVVEYLAAHGAKKVEANILAAHPDFAERIITDAITAYVPPDWPEQHEARLRPQREKVRQELIDRINANGLPPL